jgi:hypothetical protein
MNPIVIQGNLKNNDFWKCGICQNYCKVTVSCKPKEIITMNRYFWEELPTEISIYKKVEIMEYLSVTLIVGSHQIAPYGYWSHMNTETGKELIFFNTASNNFLEGTNYNYTCNPLNRPIKCMEDFAMLEIKTINGMPNIPSCSTIVILKVSDIIPVTNFCTENPKLWVLNHYQNLLT